MTQSFTGTSNNFQLVIAVAITIFRADSSQAIASTVGPLDEMPVLLGFVSAVKAVPNRLSWKGSIC